MEVTPRGWAKLLLKVQETIMNLEALYNFIWGYLGAVSTMDHEDVPWRSKSLDWLLNLSRDNFGLH